MSAGLEDILGFQHREKSTTSHHFLNVKVGALLTVDHENTCSLMTLPCWCWTPDTVVISDGAASNILHPRYMLPVVCIHLRTCIGGIIRRDLSSASLGLALRLACYMLESFHTRFGPKMQKEQFTQNELTAIFTLQILITWRIEESPVGPVQCSHNTVSIQQEMTRVTRQDYWL